MENYLSARGISFEPSVSQDGAFSSYLRKADEDVPMEASQRESNPTDNLSSEIIYDEKDCPKVEVLSLEGSPRKIVIHLPEGKVLEIDCVY